MMITDERIMLPKKKKKKNWRTFRIENQVSSSYLKFVSDCYQVREKKKHQPCTRKSIGEV